MAPRLPRLNPSTRAAPRCTPWLLLATGVGSHAGPAVPPHPTAGAAADAGVAAPVGDARLPLQRVGAGSVSPGATVTIDVFVDGVVSPSFLRGYQMTLLSEAVGGATGTLSLAPSTLTGLYTCLGGDNDEGGASYGQVRKRRWQ